MLWLTRRPILFNDVKVEGYSTIAKPATGFPSRVAGMGLIIELRRGQR